MSGQDLPHFINVILRLETLASRVQAQDTFIFYFSGHGISSQDKSYLLTLDSNTATPRTLKRSAIPLQDVNEILSEVKAHQLLIIIDACRNNPESSRSSQDNLLSDDFARGFNVQPRAVGPSGRPAVSATIYACSVGERAYEWAEKGQGVFSYFLLQGLSGAAANSQGQVTVTGLAEYTQRQVVDWAQTYRGKKQTPWLSLQGGAKLVLATGVERRESVEFVTPKVISKTSLPKGAGVLFKRLFWGGSLVSAGAAAVIFLFKRSSADQDDDFETTAVEIEVLVP